MPNAQMTKIRMVCESPNNYGMRVTWLHRSFAWEAARGVAIGTHYGVTLYGEYGTARFNGDGSGTVQWNEKSTTPGAVDAFGTNTTVCI